MSPKEAELARLLAPVARDLERMRTILIEELTDSSAAVRDMTEHLAFEVFHDLGASLLPPLIRREDGRAILQRHQFG